VGDVTRHDACAGGWPLPKQVAILVPYWIMDLQGSVILHILAAFALSSVAASTALVLGCATKDVKVALELSPLIFVPQILFAGYARAPTRHTPTPARVAMSSPLHVARSKVHVVRAHANGHASPLTSARVGRLV